MNSIASFRLCSLNDEELLKKVDELTDNLFRKQEVPIRHIPARPNEDYDLLIGELILRFNEKSNVESLKLANEPSTADKD